MTGKRVLTTGYPSLDHIARVERLGLPGETRIVEQPWRAATPGGCAANVAVALARLGTRAAACFAVGDDANSARYLEGLQRDGVDVGEVAILAGERMPQTYLFLDEHDTELYFDPGAMRDWPGPEAIDLADTARVVVTVGPVAATIAVIEHAEKQGVPIALQLKRDLTAFEPDRLRAMLARCDLLFANREEIGFLLEAVGVRHTPQVLALGPRWIVETRGSEGAVLNHEGGEFEVPVVRAEKTVDPTGAGDAFTAGVVYGLMAGAAPVVAARIGAVLASFVVEGWGCQQTLPGREDLGRRYRSVFGVGEEAPWLEGEAM